MYELQNNIFYYITAYNENYLMPKMPKNKVIEKGILAGAYHFDSTKSSEISDIHLLGSGSIMQQTLIAKNMLEEMGFDVSMWSVTSYNELYRDAEE